MAQILLIGLIGAAVFVIGLFKVRKLRASRSWVQAPGTIVEATVREDFSQGDSESPDSKTYTPVIQYQYAAAGNTLRGDRVTFDRKGYQHSADAWKVVARYPLGTPVAVFFDPAKPNQSVLERKSGSAWVLVIAGAVVLLLAVVGGIAT